MAQGSDIWKQTKRRTTFVSGTTIQSICNEHPFKNADDVFNELVGTKPHFTGNEFSLLGQTMESVIVKRYEEITGHTVETNLPITYMPGWPNVGVSPDGIVLSTKNGIILPIEIKYAPKRTIIKGTVPSYYAGQLQLTMAIFNVPRMHFVQMSVEEEIDIIEITRVDGYFEQRAEKIAAFIKRVYDYRAQNPDWENDYLRWEKEF